MNGCRKAFITKAVISFKVKMLFSYIPFSIFHQLVPLNKDDLVREEL